MTDTRVQEAAYDAVLYPDTPHFWSEPSRFSAAAVLHGFVPQSVRRARILEIGCASGANIIPIAARYPQAECYGFDISRNQIDAARLRAEEIGLANLTLVRADILDLPDNIGTFDYIIAHGISSWVPPEVRLGVWRACRSVLRAHGLLYLSYNTLPGWHFKRVVRDLLRYHAREPAAREAPETVINLFDRVHKHAQGIYKQLLDIEKQFIGERDAKYMRHEYLEEENHAFYVSDFIREGETHGFTYICEADPTSSNVDLLAREVAEAVVREARNDRAAVEQYIDFYINRTFRSSVFARTVDAPTITHRINPHALDNLQLVAVDIPPSPRHFGEGREFLALPPEYFTRTNDEQRLTRQHITVSILDALKATLPTASRSVTPTEIIAKLPASMRSHAAVGEIFRLCALEYLYRRNLAVATEPVAWSFDIQRPRLQQPLLSDAVHGRTESANILHEKITLKSDRSRFVMALLDGTRDRLEVERLLVVAAAAGTFELADDNDHRNLSVNDRIAAYLTTILEQIAALKLLW